MRARRATGPGNGSHFQRSGVGFVILYPNARPPDRPTDRAREGGRLHEGYDVAERMNGVGFGMG